MKSDDLEKMLGEQPFRKVPPEWRAEILESAREALEAQQVTTPEESRAKYGTWHWHLRWRDLLWPNPQAWAGLGAVWLLMFFANFLTSEPKAPSIALVVPQAKELTPSMVMALQEQRRFRDELLGFEATPPKSKPQPRPRSENFETNHTA